MIRGVTTLPGSLGEAQRLRVKRLERLLQVCGGILVSVGSRYAVAPQPLRTPPPDSGQGARRAFGGVILFPHTVLVWNCP